MKLLRLYPETAKSVLAALLTLTLIPLIVSGLITSATVLGWAALGVAMSALIVEGMVIGRAWDEDCAALEEGP